MARSKRRLADAVEWTIPCVVTVSGALMTVTASTREEAIAKARANEWDDIQYAQAEMVDWEPRYEAIEPNT